MSLKVYAPPAELKAPQWNPDLDWKENHKAEEKYLADLKAWCKKKGSGKEAGNEVQFPVADGAAVYIILSMKPCKLIHAPLGDAYSFPYIERLTASDIRKKILYEDKLMKLFS